MFFNKFNEDRGQMITIANRMAFVILMLLFLVIFTTYHAVTNKVIVQLIPPHLDERVTVAFNAASSQYHLKYGLYTAGLMGNANPETARAIIEALEFTFVPALYKKHREDLYLQADRLRKTSSTVEFIPTKWEHEPNTNLVFITGKQTVRPENGRARTKTMTYEFKIEVIDYVPNITHYALYEGPARNFDYRANASALAAKQN